MITEQIMTASGKSYEYSAGTRGYYYLVGMPVLTLVFAYSIYFLISSTEKFIPRGLAAIGVILFSGCMVFGLIFNYLNLGTIIVNDREIISRKRRRTVSIPWKEIDAIYHKIGGGQQDPKDPFFTVYIFSESNEFIIFNRDINGLGELMTTIRNYADTSRAKDIAFSELIKILLCRYVSGQKKQDKSKTSYRKH